MKIHERIYVVGGGINSFGLTEVLDSTVYLIDGGSSLALIDAGAGLAPELVLERLIELGFSPQYIDVILLTHAHADHCGGASWLSNACGARILASIETARFLNTKDLDAISLPPLIANGTYPKNYDFQFCNPGKLNDGDIVMVGDLQLTLLELPGHSDGHAGYLLNYRGKKLLFSGDLAFGKAKILMQNTWDCRFQPYRESLQRINALHIDGLFPGHQAFCLNGAHHIFTRLCMDTTVFPQNL